MKSKAQTLNLLQSKITRFRIPRMTIYKVSDFLINPTSLCTEISKFFKGDLVAIRSSMDVEDGADKTYAGEFHSELSVMSSDCDAVLRAITLVIDSYGNISAKNDTNQEFFVQEMLVNTSMSGVVFTHDLNTGAPYYVINYDDISGLTNTVTSGGGEYANRTLYIHRNSTSSIHSKRFKVLIEAIIELEKIIGNSFLDIEFALGSELQPYLLQVRPITTRLNWNRGVAKKIDEYLSGIHQFAQSRFTKIGSLYGSTTVFGQMPDWNPAEMIGRSPKALSYSLYRHLITDLAWARGRREMGYLDVTGYPLMVSLGGQPYIDVRLSFNSFIPKNLNSAIASKSIDAWINRLKEYPELHDKVEFEVAITAYSFDIDSRIKNQIGNLISNDQAQELKCVYREHTKLLMEKSGNGSIAEALKKINALADAEYQVVNAKNPLEIFRYINNTIENGTTPFSILARHGFIAKNWLISMEKEGILTSDEVHEFQRGIKSIASDLVNDMNILAEQQMPRSDFMKKYGHLRPGTYDILSLRYDQMETFGNVKAAVKPESQVNINYPNYKLSNHAMDRIQVALDQHSMGGIKADYFVEYLKSAIVSREYSKFVFTKSISEILEAIALYGEALGLSRDEMANVPIESILESLNKAGPDDRESVLREISQNESEKHFLTSAIRLPQILSDPDGVFIVPFQVNYPNFITRRKVTGQALSLIGGEQNLNLEGKVILIENADPGFDWIFAHKISGLVTKFGGANSHMAIRCAEFDIAAAIGCGEQRFERLILSKKIVLDCMASMVYGSH